MPISDAARNEAQEFLRWAADGRVVRLFFPRAALKELPLEVTNHLANLVAAGQDVPRGLILRVAAAALAVLPDAAELAALAVGGGDQALGAAVILAGKLRKAGAG